MSQSSIPPVVTDTGTSLIAPAVILTIFGTKGGVGKTSLCGNLGALCADAGLKVLLVDADPQGSLGAFYSLTHQADSGIVQLIQRTVSLTECISKTAIEGLDVVVSNDPEAVLETWITAATNRGPALRLALAPARDRYDLIIIDTQGADGMGKTQELALRAADQILMPIVPDAVVVRELTTNSFQLLDKLQPLDSTDIKNRLPPPHTLIYRVKSISTSHQVFTTGLRALLDDHTNSGTAIRLRTEVPEAVAYNDAQSVLPATPVHRKDPVRRRKNQIAPSAAESMYDLALELLPQYTNALQNVKPRDYGDFSQSFQATELAR